MKKITREFLEEMSYNSHSKIPIEELENFNPEGYEKFDLPIHGAPGFGVLIKNEG